jgi:hypothetical protein
MSPRKSPENKPFLIEAATRSFEVLSKTRTTTIAEKFQCFSAERRPIFIVLRRGKNFFAASKEFSVLKIYETAARDASVNEPARRVPGAMARGALSVQQRELSDPRAGK